MLTPLRTLPFDGLHLDLGRSQLPPAVQHRWGDAVLDTLHAARAAVDWPLALTTHFRELQTPDFAQRVSMQCGTPFYAALAELTHVWLIRFRTLLDELYDLPIPDREQMSQRINRKLVMDKAEVAPIRFMPGAQGPSW